MVDVSFSATVNGRGYRFDILNDTLGAVLITIGVVRLAGAPVGGRRYAGVMRFVTAVSILSIVQTAIKHFVFPHPTLLGAAMSLL